jgi:transcription elongation GreA/GreB family factor
MSNIDTQIDYAADVVKRLSSDYAELMNSVSTTLEALRGLPKTIDDEATLEAYSKVIKDGRDLRKRLDAYHDAEKQPYLRSGQGVDQFFFSLEEKLARRKPRDPAGGLDIADARVDDYMQKKLAAERAERERVAREERAKAEAEQKRVDDARRAAEEAAAKAARARNEQNITAHREEAARQARIAEEARADEVLASQKAEDAQIDTKASAADMTRTRLDTGAVATMAQVPFVQIDDVTKLDKELLWPFLKEEHVLMALKAWAKTRSHKTPMAGATIELRNKGRVV